MYKVMIVDDERIIREGIASIINWEENGMVLLGTAQNGLEAINKIDEVQPDIVITDIKMPILDGLKLIELIREKYPKINFVILSGYGEFEFASKAMSYGVKHYILKPCSENRIIDVLKEVISDIKKSENRDLIFNYDEIINAVNFGDATKAINGIKEFIAYLKIASLSRNICRAYCNELLINILRCGKASDIEKYFKVVNEINSIENIEDVEDLFIAITNSILQSNSENIMHKQNKIISSVKDYINVNYMDEDLSLKKIAKDVLFMDEGYLSKLFCKSTGEKFSCYLTQIRMEKAKKLIEEGMVDKIYDVAQKVGFGDNPQYFSQVFKKYTGCSPSEYNK